MTHTTSAASTSTASTMGNGNKKSTSNSFLSDDLHENSTKVNGSVIIKWTLTEVQTWVKEQCKKFELKKTTAENFQMNGQALMLLTKHDFIRRSPHGGEILYYALQRLITPNKAVNLTNINSNLLRNGSTDAHPRIVELSADHVEQNGATGASSSQPIVEEPDDPPAIRRSNSDIEQNNYQQQQYNQPYIFNSANIPQTVLTMQAGTAAAFFQQHHQEQQQQQQQYPNAYMYPYHHHPHMHINQQPVFYPPMFQQYYPMMSAQGILIEIMDDEEPKNANSNEVNGSTSGTNHTTKELLFMVTVNGQRYIMNEAQVIQLVTDVYQQQNYQTQLQQQQQQLFQQQQQQRVFQQQQQQRVFQQRQNFYQK
ncbi:unnamed protein product [Rotaria magnacalcarata]|uniref:PNT domain-containing protein n=5 Tax=Rotaria magnacalcarata TaxID=392030 RepID=A0A816ZAL5_9BILA|nr:unnamed protein product [Rotaria magnacalcarata]CAF2195709.1 unnamed protein product [Rotaria magnacalcarata]CAF2268512.1 unnamed protein product [Rotaria magnacalcarata]CAF3954523.1 unnamed protein product [Rotaria magnacalcarata]CAF4029433.1 unnamed protein product [Rotaria magnacalcarata]